MKTEELTIRKGQLAYRKTGGRGYPIIFLHGLMDSSWSFDEYSLLLSRPGIAFDLPGFGDSSARGTNSLRDWSKTIIGGIEALGVEKFHLVGHSLGGALASDIADRKAENTESLTLISSAGYSPIPLAHILARPEVEIILGQTAPHAIRIKPLVRLAYRSLFTHGSGIDGELLERVIRDRKRTIPGIREGVHILDKLNDHHFKSNHYRGDVTVIWGAHDHLISKAGIDAIKKIWQNADVHLLPDSGHHPQEEEKEKVFQIIQKATGSKKSKKDSIAELKVEL
jgi:pyruvate dehydrogenase E2 component (dihydrolipoamide acetyltransferase)